MWSATIALYRGVAEAFGPVGGAALIFSMASIFAWLGALRQGPLRLSKGYLLLGGAFFVSYEIALALAVGFTVSREQALEVGMVNYLWPCLTISLAIFVGQERADWRMWPGLLLCLLGVMWVASGNEGLSASRMIENIQSNPLAYALALIAALLWPAYTLLTRVYSNGQNGVPVFLTATALVLWTYYGVSDEPSLRFDKQGAVMVISFGLLTTLAYTAWNYGVLHGNLAIMSATSYFAPVLSVVTSALIFGMTPSGNFWIGALVVTGGSLLCWMATATRD